MRRTDRVLRSDNPQIIFEKYRTALDNYPIRLDFDTPNRTVFWVYSNNIILHRSKDRLEKYICLKNKQLVYLYVKFD